jgi:hypothetical protein
MSALLGSGTKSKTNRKLPKYPYDVSKHIGAGTREHGWKPPEHGQVVVARGFRPFFFLVDPVLRCQNDQQ